MSSEELVVEAFERSSDRLNRLFDLAFNLSRSQFSKDIIFSVPGLVHYDTSFYRASDPHRFPSISITGEVCHLNCQHCRREILKNMIPAITPERLWEVCFEIKQMGGKGCLISGGSLGDGSVPLEPFIPVIDKIKKELSLDIVVHTGIVSPKLAESLAETNIDATMMDIIGSNETIKKVYHPNLSVDDLERSLSLLTRKGIPIVPHVVAGIHYGKLKGEKKALRIISKHSPMALVIVVLTPLEKTPMEYVDPPPPIDVGRVILASRFMMPTTPIILGCIRPGGRHKAETDVLSIQAGVNGIAYPSQEGYDYAKKIGLEIKFSEECCSLMYRNMTHEKSKAYTEKITAYGEKTTF